MEHAIEAQEIAEKNWKNIKYQLFEQII
jgi:hypothetical protein